MARGLETTTKFKVDVAELKAGLKSANDAIALTNSELKKSTAGMKKWGDSADGIKAKITQLKSVNQSYQQILDAYKNKYNEVIKKEGENSSSANSLKIKINSLEGAIKGNETAIKNYSQDLTDMAKESLTGADATQKLSDGFTVVKGVIANLVADGINKLTSSIIDFGKNAIETGMNFESSMSNVAALSGATGDELDSLEKTARQYGATTQFSASQAADALGYMALAGWDAEQSTDALGGVLDLAAASGMDLASASDMVTDYLSAFGLQASDSAKFADEMAYAQSNSNTTTEQLGEAVKNCAANMNASGQSVETTTSALAMLANQGLKGSEAGTALTAIMRDMTAKMKDGAVLLNVGRGMIVDSDALFDALESGKLSGAAVDVTDPEPLPAEHPLWQQENAVITPHVYGGFHLPETHDRIIRIMAENLSAFCAGKPLRNVVDFETGYRKL